MLIRGWACWPIQRMVVNAVAAPQLLRRAAAMAMMCWVGVTVGGWLRGVGGAVTFLEGVVWFAVGGVFMIGGEEELVRKEKGCVMRITPSIEMMAAVCCRRVNGSLKNR